MSGGVDLGSILAPPGFGTPESLPEGTELSVQGLSQLGCDTYWAWTHHQARVSVSQWSPTLDYAPQSRLNLC